MRVRGLVGETEDCALWGPRIEQAQLPEQHRCWPENSAQKGATLGDAVASADTRFVDHMYESVEDMEVAQQPYPVLHEAAERVDPKNPK